jgi:DNA mismatch repair ATPase MutL
MYSMTICKLPSEVQSALRSGIVISSMAQCVDELVSPTINFSVVASEHA